MKFILGGIDYFAPENADLLEALEKHMATEFSTENIEFLKDLRDVSVLDDPDYITEAINRLDKTYIDPKSPTQINLPSGLLNDLYGTREKVGKLKDQSLTPKQKLEAVTDLAGGAIKTLVSRDTYARFLNSSVFRQAIINRNQEKIQSKAQAHIDEYDGVKDNLTKLVLDKVNNVMQLGVKLQKSENPKETEDFLLEGEALKLFIKDKFIPDKMKFSKAMDLTGAVPDAFYAAIAPLNKAIKILEAELNKETPDYNVVLKQVKEVESAEKMLDKAYEAEMAKAMNKVQKAEGTLKKRKSSIFSTKKSLERAQSARDIAVHELQGTAMIFSDFRGRSRSSSSAEPPKLATEAPKAETPKKKGP